MGLSTPHTWDHRGMCGLLSVMPDCVFCSFFGLGTIWPDLARSAQGLLLALHYPREAQGMLYQGLKQ